MQEKPDSDVRVIERISALLDALSEQESCSLTELAGTCGLAVSTASRLLDSLERGGFVHRDRVTKRYELGWKLFRLVAGSKPRRDITSAIHPILEWLVGETGEDAGLAELQGVQAVIIDSVEGPSPLKIITRINKPEPLYFGAFRKVLLAFQPDEWIDSYIRELKFEKFTATTITSAAALRREIEEIREQRYATSYGEKLVDAVGFAAPVFDYSGSIRATVQIVVPQFRVNKRAAARYIQAVVQAAQQSTALLDGQRGAGLAADPGKTLR